MPGFARRMQDIPGSASVAMGDMVARKRAAGEDIISFSLGEPDFATPPHVCEAAKKALDDGHTHYTPGKGIPELRAAIVDQAEAPCTVEQVLVTPAKQAVMMAIQATVGPGDEVVIPDPGWVSYAPCVSWAGGTAVPVPLGDGFRLTPDALAEICTSRTRLIVVNSPSNPTGGVCAPSDIRGICQIAEDHDAWILSDEIYRHLIYDGMHLSPSVIRPERTIVVDGLSKSFAMTGWRMGWMIAPEEVVREVGKLQEHSITHCTSFAQYGAVAALTGPQDSVAVMRDAFRSRRDEMVAGLRRINGVTCEMPAGAFYAFPRMNEDVWGDDEAACQRLIDQGVATTPGSAFGAKGRGHLRLSYAAGTDAIREGLRRIERAARAPKS